MTRPTWDNYFMNIAHVVKTRSNCIKRKVGCIIIDDKEKIILSTGYNGSPRNMLNCMEGGCIRCNNKDIKSGEKLDICICMHAEENAIIYLKDKTKDMKIYITTKPCLTCLIKIVQIGIKNVIYDEEYPIDNNIIKEYFGNIIEIKKNEIKK